MPDFDGAIKRAGHHALIFSKRDGGDNAGMSTKYLRAGPCSNWPYFGKLIWAPCDCCFCITGQANSQNGATMTTKGFHTRFLFYTPHTRCAVGIAGDTIVSTRRNGNGQHSTTQHSTEDFTSLRLEAQQSGQALWVAHQPVRLRTLWTPDREETVETLVRGLEKRKCGKGVQKYIVFHLNDLPWDFDWHKCQVSCSQAETHVFSIIIILYV